MPSSGKQRKDAAHAYLKSCRAALVRKAQRALLAYLLDGNTQATADHVREFVPIPAGINPVAMGPVPVELAKAGIIEPNGWVNSTRPEAHARPIQVWQLVDAHAARLWLASHAELPEPPCDKQPELFGDDEPHTTHDQKPLGEVLADGIETVFKRLNIEPPKPLDKTGGQK